MRPFVNVSGGANAVKSIKPALNFISLSPPPLLCVNCNRQAQSLHGLVLEEFGMFLSAQKRLRVREQRWKVHVLKERQQTSFDLCSSMKWALSRQHSVILLTPATRFHASSTAPASSSSSPFSPIYSITNTTGCSRLLPDGRRLCAGTETRARHQRGAWVLGRGGGVRTRKE